MASPAAETRATYNELGRLLSSRSRTTRESFEVLHLAATVALIKPPELVVDSTRGTGDRTWLWYRSLHLVCADLFWPQADDFSRRSAACTEPSVRRWLRRLPGQLWDQVAMGVDAVLMTQLELGERTLGLDDIDAVMKSCYPFGPQSLIEPSPPRLTFADISRVLQWVLSTYDGMASAGPSRIVVDESHEE